MFVLLEAHEHWLVTALQKPEQAATFITIVGGAIVAVIVKVSVVIDRAKTAAREAKVPPIAVAIDDPARAELRALLEEARRAAAEANGFAKRWRQDDAETKLAELVPELRATKRELIESRAMSAELLRVNEAQRLQIAQLQLALDNSEDVLEVVPAHDDWAEDTGKIAKIKE